jgi:hypothetical protein
MGMPFTMPALANGCLGRARYPVAAPYTGKGPHPIAIVHHSGSQDEAGPDMKDYPVEWRPWWDPSIIQLIACVDTEDGPTIGTCTYRPVDVFTGRTSGPVRNVPLKAVAYHVTVQEAHTGAYIGEVRFNGSTGCIEHASADITAVSATATPQQYHDELQRFVY